MLFPFVAAYYSEKNRRKISELVVPNLDTAEHLWGARDSSQAFRNVLVGSPEQRGEIWQAWISNGEVRVRDVKENIVYSHHFNPALIAGDGWECYCFGAIIRGAGQQRSGECLPPIGRKQNLNVGAVNWCLVGIYDIPGNCLLRSAQYRACRIERCKAKCTRRIDNGHRCSCIGTTSTTVTHRNPEVHCSSNSR